VIAALLARARKLISAPPQSSSPEPLPLAGALIADQFGRLLLLHRNTPEMAWWEVPGGKVKVGEHRWHAAQRELAEELNVTVDLVAEVGTEQFSQGRQTLEYTWYVARLRDGAPAPELMEPDRFDRLRYFTWDEVRSLRDASPSVQCLRDRRAEIVTRAISSDPRADLVS